MRYSLKIHRVRKRILIGALKMYDTPSLDILLPIFKMLKDHMSMILEQEKYWRVIFYGIIM